MTTFSNRMSAKAYLQNVVEKYTLCQKLTGLYTTKGSCFNYSVKACNGACLKKELPEDYNIRVEQLIGHNSFYDKSLIIIDKGREISEHSVVLIENGIFKGYGYFDLNYQVNSNEVLHTLITPMDNNRDIQHIIKSYIRGNKHVKIKELPREREFQ